MAESSDARHLESIEPEWILLKRLEAHQKQEALAHAAGIDAGTLSAFKNNKGALKISNLKLLLKAVGLKLVPVDSRCVKESTFREISALAAKAMQERPQLLWDEDGE